MKRFLALLLCVSALLASAACTYVPKVGMKETTWLRHTISYDLVSMDAHVKIYRSDGAYYYFKDGSLVKVGQELVSAEQI